MGIFDLRPYDWGDFLTVQDVARHFGQNPPYVDVESDIFRDFRIEFFYPHTSATISFKAFLNQYAEGFSSEYEMVSVYGRMDPTAHFQRTNRSLQIAWTAPAASHEEALLNLQNASKLARVMYPVYGPGQGTDSIFGSFQDATEMKAPPRVVMRFSNLIKRGGLPGQDPNNLATAGLNGVIQNYNWQPVIEDGFFDGVPPDGVSNNVALLPKTLSFSISFQPIHRDVNGWAEDGRWLGDAGFPWLPGSAPTPNSTTFTEAGFSGTDDGCTDLESALTSTAAAREECEVQILNTIEATQSEL